MISRSIDLEDQICMECYVYTDLIEIDVNLIHINRTRCI